MSFGANAGSCSGIKSRKPLGLFWSTAVYADEGCNTNGYYTGFASQNQNSAREFNLQNNCT
jgi:hypothetical protein